MTVVDVPSFPAAADPEVTGQLPNVTGFRLIRQIARIDPAQA